MQIQYAGWRELDKKVAQALGYEVVKQNGGLMIAVDGIVLNPLPYYSAHRDGMEELIEEAVPQGYTVVYNDNCFGFFAEVRHRSGAEARSDEAVTLPCAVSIAFVQCAEKVKEEPDVSLLKKRKTCKQCRYYIEYSKAPKLLPDKTVVPGGITRRWCDYGDFELHDLEPCELFQYDYDWIARIPLPELPDKEEDR